MTESVNAAYVRAKQAAPGLLDDLARLLNRAMEGRWPLERFRRRAALCRLRHQAIPAADGAGRLAAAVVGMGAAIAPCRLESGATEDEAAPTGAATDTESPSAQPTAHPAANLQGDAQ